MKGMRELELRRTDKPDLMKVEAKAYAIQPEQMDSYEWFSSETAEESGEDDREKDFFETPRQVSRKTKPSSPGGASSET